MNDRKKEPRRPTLFTKCKYGLLTRIWILDTASANMRMAAASMRSPTRATEMAKPYPDIWVQ